MSHLEIQRADIMDIDRLMTLRVEVIRDVFAPQVPDESLIKANRRYYVHALSAGTHIACIARKDLADIGCGGMCLQHEMPSPDNPSGRCAYLMNIYVKPFWRHRGVGRKIVEWLVSEAQALGIGKIYLETTDGARRLYRSVGFTDMENMMKLKQ